MADGGLRSLGVHLAIWKSEDYFCCPQNLSSVDDRKMAVKSIPYYVETCQYFVILCPPVRHACQRHLLSNFGAFGFSFEAVAFPVLLDLCFFSATNNPPRQGKSTWLSRGWCRLELVVRRPGTQFLRNFRPADTALAFQFTTIG